MKSQIVVSRPKQYNPDGGITLVYHQRAPKAGEIWHPIVLDTPSDVPASEIQLSLHIDRVLLASTGTLLIAWATPGPNTQVGDVRFMAVKRATRLFITALDWTPNGEDYEV